MLLKHICLWVLSGGLQPWQLVFPRCPSCSQVIGLEFLHQLDTIFPPNIATLDQHHDSVQHAVLGLSE